MRDGLLFNFSFFSFFHFTEYEYRKVIKCYKCSAGKFSYDVILDIFQLLSILTMQNFMIQLTLQRAWITFNDAVS